MHKEVQEAIQASPKEHAVYAAVQAELTKAESKIKDINAAMHKLRAAPPQRSSREERSRETKTVAGVVVPIETVISTPNDLHVLASAMDVLRTDEQHLRRQLECARRDLSRAVAKRLLPQQKKLQARTLKVLEDLTSLCRDGQALENAITQAGLDDEGVFTVRYQAIQSLRTDEGGTYGDSIKAGLKEAA